MNQNIVAPTCHLNGSSPQSLLADNVAVRDLLQQTLDSLCNAAPSARDYYIQGQGYYETARQQWEEKLNTLESLLAKQAVLTHLIQQQVDEKNRHLK